MLPKSVIIKLDALRKRRDEIEVLLSQEDATNDINNFKALSCLLYTSPSPRDPT